MKRYSITYLNGCKKMFNKRDFVNELYSLLNGGATLKLGDDHTKIFVGYSRNWRDNNEYIFSDGYGTSAYRNTKSDIRWYMDENYYDIKVVD